MIVNEEACFFQKKLAESLKLLLLPHKKERLDICQDALFIQIEAIELLLLVPEDILFHAFPMFDIAGMAVHVAQLSQNVVTAGNFACSVVDVKKGCIIPQFHLIGINGVAGFGREFEIAQHGHRRSRMHIAGEAVRA